MKRHRRKQTNGPMDRQSDGQMYRRTDRNTQIWTDRQTVRQRDIVGEREGRIDIVIKGETGKWTDGHMVRRRDEETDTQRGRRREGGKDK